MFFKNANPLVLLFFPLCLFSSHLQVSQVNEVMVFENAGGVDENITR
jgi:hypothetical protein